MKESRRKFLSKLPTRAYTISMIAGSIASTGCERSSILVDSTNIKNATIDPSLLGSAAEGVALGVFNNITMRVAGQVRTNLIVGI